MENTFTSLLQNYTFTPVKSRRSERGDLLDYFLEKINLSRVGTNFKPMTKSGMAYLLSVYTTEQLYHLRFKCDKASNFAKCFWWYSKCLPDKYGNK